MRASKYFAHTTRRGTVTVIVVAFLALFAAVGITFLVASQRYAATSRIGREAMTRERDTPPEPDVLFQTVLHDILYDAPDDDKGAYKGIRGHGLARAMYGQHPTASLNTLPYSGIGRHRANTIPPSLVSTLYGAGYSGDTTDFKLLNYTYFPKNADGTTDGFFREPERGNAAGPGSTTLGAGFKAAPPATAPPGPTGNDYFWPYNANYTAPDETNAYLAVVDPVTGKVLLPSFHRPHCFAHNWGAWNATSDPWAMNPTNPNWSNRVGKYLTFRPRPNEHSPSFPMPTPNYDGSNTYGDVENLTGKPGGTQLDSIWMDLDLDVKYWKGKRYKPLVALLITTLDDRLNLNTAGNLRNVNPSLPQPYSHGSNQHWGPWEADLSPVMSDGGDAFRLLRGNGNSTGRYGGATATSNTTGYPTGYAAPGPFRKVYTTHATGAVTDNWDNNPVGGVRPHFYAPVDMDGARYGTTAAAWQAPRPGSNSAAYESSNYYGPPTPTVAPAGFMNIPPYDPNNRYWNGETDKEAAGATKYTERLNHPMLFSPYLNPYNQAQSAGSFNPKTFAPSEMLGLNLRYTYPNNAVHPLIGGATLNTNSGMLRSDVAKLTYLGLTPAAGSAANRFRVTTISNDLAAPGATPWFYKSDAINNGKPQFVSQYPYITAPQPHATDMNMFDGDYDPIRRQNLLTVLGSVDINRPLTEYRDNALAPFSVGNLANATQVLRAKQERQQLAADIYVRLRAAVGLPEPNAIVTDPAMNQHGAAQLGAARMLAQLAVNMVDQIDSDDYSTPFNWFFPATGGTPPPAKGDPGQEGDLDTTAANTYWVFGHEMPRLVINEALVRLENDPNEPDIKTPVQAGGTAKMPYKARVWAELHNRRTPRDATEVGDLADGAAAILNTGGAGAYNVYRLRLVKNTPAAAAALLNPANTGGEPPAAELILKPDGTPLPAAVLNTGVAGTMTKVFPNGIPAGGNGYFNDPVNPAFYIVGCAADAPMGGGLPKLPDSVALQAHGQFENLEYEVKKGATGPGMEPAEAVSDAQYSPIIVLQRLANEHQPPGVDNPYITVDTFLTGTYPNPGGDRIENPTPVSIMQDRVQLTPTVDRIKNMMVPEYDTIDSFGKRQPFRSYIHMTGIDDPRYQQQPAGAAAKTIRHTFTRHNGKNSTDGAESANDTLDRVGSPAQGFTAHPHLDRRVTGAAELANVSLFGSHMVMPLFYTGTGKTKMMYQADLLNPATGLTRAFDLLKTHGPFHGQSHGGRTPGLVNVNMLFDTQASVLKGLTDFNNLGGTNGKFYDQPAVADLWTKLTTARGFSATSADTVRTALVQGSTRPILGTLSPTTTGLPTPDPQYPFGTGPAQTIPGVLHSTTYTSQRAKDELAQTLLPQLTTRSNTFAIYATIGFFEVLNEGTGVDGLSYPDASGNRPILGAEIVGSSGKSTRYKFYSVVDRTQLSYAFGGGKSLQGVGTVNFSYEPLAQANAPDPIPANGPVQVAIPRTDFRGVSGTMSAEARGNYDGIQWRLTVGSQLQLEANPDGGTGPGSIATGNDYLPQTGLVGSTRNRAEIVNVTEILNDPPNNRCIIKFAISKAHARGCNISMQYADSGFPFSSAPGNPGSQKDTFNKGASTYRTVIPVFERIDDY